MSISITANSLKEMRTMLGLNQLCLNFSMRPTNVCPDLNVTFLRVGVTGED
jgi:hypothetical protein